MYPDKKPYRVDLQKHNLMCDGNYIRLLKLLPDTDNTDAFRFAVSFSDGSTAEILLKVLDRSKFTTTLSFERMPKSPWLQAKSLAVRMYHDARTAEVLASEQGRQYEAKYDYPNKKMLQENEKVLANEFLAQWLSYCLDFGHSIDEIHLA